MAIYHKNLIASGKWFALSFCEQMGNIGSEVGRAIKSHKMNDTENRNLAIERALELFDLTANDERWKTRLKEILRAREVFCDVFFGKNSYNVPLEKLEEYFMEFAVAARINR